MFSVIIDMGGLKSVIFIFLFDPASGFPSCFTLGMQDIFIVYSVSCLLYLFVVILFIIFTPDLCFTNSPKIQKAITLPFISLFFVLFHMYYFCMCKNPVKTMLAIIFALSDCFLLTELKRRKKVVFYFKNTITISSVLILFNIFEFSSVLITPPLTESFNAFIFLSLRGKTADNKLFELFFIFLISQDLTVS